MEALKLSIEVGAKLREQGATLSTAESCTGGMIAHLITAVAGSSEYFNGSVVSYANDVKIKVLGVSSESISRDGAVSERVVKEMAVNVRKLLGTDYSVATSGIAGPGGGSAEKPVGTVWMAVANEKRVVAKCFRFDGKDRGEIIEQSAQRALGFLLEFLQEK